MPQQYLPYIAICISALSALFTGLNIYLNWRNQDRYGLKKIVFDKKLKAVMDLHESVNSLEIGIISKELAHVDTARRTKKHIESKNIDFRGKGLYLDQFLVNYMFDTLLQRAQHPLIDRKIYNSTRFINGPFKIIKAQVIPNSALIVKPEQKEPVDHIYTYDDGTTVHDFLDKIEGIQIEIEKWINANTSLKNVLRKD